MLPSHTSRRAMTFSNPDASTLSFDGGSLGNPGPSAGAAAPVAWRDGPAPHIPARYLEGKFASVTRKRPGEASFQDLTGIKVGGSDAFSRLKRDALLVLLGSDAVAATDAIEAALSRGKP